MLCSLSRLQPVFRSGGQRPVELISPITDTEPNGLRGPYPPPTDINNVVRRPHKTRHPDMGSCSDDSGSESMIEMTDVSNYVGIPVDKISGIRDYNIYMPPAFPSELNVDDATGVQQHEEYKDKDEKKITKGKVRKRKDSVKVRKTVKSPGDHTPQKDRLSRDSGLDEQPITPVTADKDKRVLSTPPPLEYSNQRKLHSGAQRIRTYMCILCLGI